MCVRIQLIIHLFTSSKTHRRVAIIELVLLLTSNTTITQSFWFKLEPSSVRRWKMHVMTMMFSDTKWLCGLRHVKTQVDTVHSMFLCLCLCSVLFAKYGRTRVAYACSTAALCVCLDSK